ncbi:hypothetical protein MTO96_048877 [Rhipicephalus appendiculatus]
MHQGIKSRPSTTCSAIRKVTPNKKRIRVAVFHQEMIETDIQGHALRRDVGLFSSITFLLSATIGTGVFITPGSVLRNSKTIGIDLFVWTIGGLNAFVGGLCTAELGALLPASGGDYAYLLAAGRPYGKYGDVPAFLFAWTSFFMDPAYMSIQGLTFSACVLSLPYPNCAPPYEVEVLLACVFISNHMLGSQTSGTFPSPGAVASAIYSAIYSYHGWNTINCIAEEIKSPGRNIPIAMAVSIAISVVTYLLTNLAFFVVLDADTIKNTDVVAITFVRATWGQGMATFVPLIIGVTMAGTMCVEVLASSRIAFAASRQGHLARVMSYVHVDSSVPLLAVMVHCMLSLAFTLTGSVHFLIQVNVLLANVLEAASVASLFLLRRSMPDVPRPYRVPTAVAVLRLVVCLVLAAVTLVEVRQIKNLCSPKTVGYPKLPNVTSPIAHNR